MVAQASTQKVKKSTSDKVYDTMPYVFFIAIGAVVSALLHWWRPTVLSFVPSSFFFAGIWSEVISGALYTIFITYYIDIILEKKEAFDDEDDCTLWEFLFICWPYGCFAGFLAITLLASIVWTPIIGLACGIVTAVVHLGVHSSKSLYRWFLFQQ